MKKQLILFVFNILLITVFFILPQNRKWLNEKVFVYLKEFKKQKEDLDLEHRKIERWRTDYIYSKAISDSLKKKSIKAASLVLLPPTNYFKHYGVDFHVPEPAVFYYYTGVRTIWANSGKAANATWRVGVKNGKIAIDTVVNSKDLQDSITLFKKMGVSL
ncbi:MAG TPA: hypothetical protein VGQ09_12755 [Chitinophagaceae bacterium]|nr:hypothetical protein [Chitinophagaceae bacterium]